MFRVPLSMHALSGFIFAPLYYTYTTERRVGKDGSVDRVDSVGRDYYVVNVT